MKKKTKIYLLIAALGIIIILGFTVIAQYTFSNSTKYLRSLNKDDLEKEKLIQEIENVRSIWNVLSNYAPFITALAALLGLFVTIWKQIEQKRSEIQIRKEEKFESIAAKLSADNQTTCAIAAADLQYANLKNTQFQNARMQSVRFKGARLHGARFEGANIGDTQPGKLTHKETLIRTSAQPDNWLTGCHTLPGTLEIIYINFKKLSNKKKIFEIRGKKIK
jgi:hypothetical protein